jgi:hypothetical protein
MTGPRPAGHPWTPGEEAQLRALIASKVKVGLIAKKLKRSPGAIYARINSLKKLPRDLPFSAQSRSLPSERLAAFAKREVTELREGKLALSSPRGQAASLVGSRTDEI